MGIVNKKKLTVKGKFGNGYKAFSRELGDQPAMEDYWLETEYSEEFESLPITVECWVNILNRNVERNVFISNGSKLNLGHWELCVDYSNTFSAFLPGLYPKPISTDIVLEKSRWYYLAMVVNEEHIQLYIDGVEAKCVKISKDEVETPPLNEQGLSIGGDGILSYCSAIIDSVKISNCVKKITGIPEERFEVDAFTIGLWDFEIFDNSKGFMDLSGANRNLKQGKLKEVSLNEIERKKYGGTRTPLDIQYEEVELFNIPVIHNGGPEEISLDGEWEMAEEGCLTGDLVERLKGEWLDSIPAIVPGSVHTALVKNGLIPDPSFGHNYGIAKLKSHKKWWFKKKFKSTLSGNKIKLIFEGVSAECEVWLNGKRLGRHNGAFGGPEFEVGDLLKAENVLLVNILPAPEGSCWTAWQSTVVFNCVYGWHYVNLPAIGIWRSVKLVEESEIRWEKPFVAASGSENVLNGRVDLYVALKSEAVGLNGKLICTIEPDNFIGEAFSFIYKVASEVSEKKVHLRFKVPEYKLWWPLDIGPQNLYRIKISFKPDSYGKALYYEATFGIRSIEMEPSGDGPRSNRYNWKFVINGKPIFVKGTNWCVTDALMDFSRERYDRFLSFAAAQHVQILRAWGGGLAETGDFYDLCDRKGIMVIQEWQTCWNSHFNQSYEVFEETVRLNTQRIRNHPSLIMWAGGNESSLPYGRVIDMMARYSLKFDGTRPFHRGDGFGNEHIHIIWENKSIEYYTGLENIMLNEFGLCSSPNLESVQRYIPEKEMGLWPQPSGGSFYAHLPAFNERNEMELLCEYIKDFIDAKSIEDFVIGTQIAHASALRHKMERARSRWPFETGVMSYKLNDVYIGVSWASVDWYGVPKMAHYFTQDSYMPLHACVLFNRLNGLVSGEVLPIFLLDDSEELANTKWSVRISIYNGDLSKLRILEYKGVGSVGGLNKVGEIVLTKAEAEAIPLLIVSEVLKDSKISDRTFYWLNYKSVQGCLFNLPKTKVDWKEEGEYIFVSNVGEVPAVGTYFDCPEISAVFNAEDSYFWLEPGEKRRIKISPKNSRVNVKAWNTI